LVNTNGEALDVLVCVCRHFFGIRFGVEIPNLPEIFMISHPVLTDEETIFPKKSYEKFPDSFVGILESLKGSMPLTI
jgi:hypothetical protein